jgi:protein involved in polysaccharide export with SLBB domain
VLVRGEKEEEEIKLLPGDVIYVPVMRESVKVLGEVRNPGEYEIVEGDRLKDIIEMAGGLTPKGKPSRRDTREDKREQERGNRTQTIRFINQWRRQSKHKTNKRGHNNNTGKGRQDIRTWSGKKSWIIHNSKSEGAVTT